MHACWCHACMLVSCYTRHQCARPTAQGGIWLLQRLASASLLSSRGFDHGNAFSNIVMYNHYVSSPGKCIIGNILYITIPVGCGQPLTPGNGSIQAYQNTTAGAEIFFRCNPGFVPAGRMTAVCTAGRWTPDPATLVCTGEIS